MAGKVIGVTPLAAVRGVRSVRSTARRFAPIGISDRARADAPGCTPSDTPEGWALGSFDFGSTVGMLKNAMTGASIAHDAIANNVANVNTPNYRRTDVSFKAALAAADPSPSTADGDLPMATTDARHMAASGAAAAQPFEPEITVDGTTRMRADGSNVDVDQEMAKLSLNSAYAQTMTQLLQSQYARLREAVSEQA